MASPGSTSPARFVPRLPIDSLFNVVLVQKGVEASELQARHELIGEHAAISARIGYENLWPLRTTRGCIDHVPHAERTNRSHVCNPIGKRTLGKLYMWPAATHPFGTSRPWRRSAKSRSVDEGSSAVAATTMGIEWRRRLPGRGTGGGISGDVGVMWARGQPRVL